MLQAESRASFGSHRCPEHLCRTPVHTARARPLAGARDKLRLRVRPVFAQAGSGADDYDQIIAKYSQPSSKPAYAQGASAPKPVPARPAAGSLAGGNGVFLLLLVNVAVFVLDHVMHWPGIQFLYLNHLHPQWYQWLTHAFCHGNFAHLSANLFNICVFGKLVEETEGGFGVWFIYCITAVGAALASYLAARSVPAVSVGASGAIFGMYAVAVLTRLRLDIRRLLEAAILGQFVVQQVLQEARNHVAGGLVVGGMQVSHIAHLGGALAGVALVWLLSKIPDPGRDV